MYFYFDIQSWRRDTGASPLQSKIAAESRIENPGHPRRAHYAPSWKGQGTHIDEYLYDFYYPGYIVVGVDDD